MSGADDPVTPADESQEAEPKGNANQPTWRRPKVITAVIGGMVAVVVAVIGINWAINSNNTTVTIEGDACVMVDGEGNKQECTSEDNELSEDQTEAIEESAEEGGDPEGDGPWSFVVVNTGSAGGLYVRDGTAEYNNRVQEFNGTEALVLEGKPVWVVCSATGWNMDNTAEWDWTKTDGGGQWFKVNYPSAADVGEYWMYSAWLAPVGHNGNVPSC